MRQAYELPPWLAANNTPIVKSTSGLGVGGGASVQTPDSGGFGDIPVQVGSASVGAGGNIVITFPSTPPTLFISCSEGLVSVSQATVGNDVTITWTGTPRINSRQNIHYEWLDPTKSN